METEEKEKPTSNFTRQTASFPTCILTLYLAKASVHYAGFSWCEVCSRLAISWPRKTVLCGTSLFSNDCETTH
jgi:hypothetical protein